MGDMKCPFCGGVIEYSYRSFNDSKDTITFTVQLTCRDCGAKTIPITEAGWDIYEDVYFNGLDWKWEKP